MHAKKKIISKYGLWLSSFTLGLALVAGPAFAGVFPIGDSHPFRKFYPAPSVKNSPSSSLLSCGLDDDIVHLYQAEVDAAADAADGEDDSPKQLAHQHALFQEKNRKLEAALQSYAKNAKRAHGTGVGQKVISEVHSALALHPIAGKGGEAKYDLSQKVGFCFGRAAYVHLELSKRGVPQGDMLKLFVFGKLLHSGQIWKFHVATGVLGSGPAGAARKWWVIDSLFDRPLKLEEWMKRVTAFSVLKAHPDTRVYATDPRKFQPISGEYTSESMGNPAFQGYFEDLYLSLLPALKPGP